MKEKQKPDPTKKNPPEIANILGVSPIPHHVTDTLLGTFVDRVTQAYDHRSPEVQVRWVDAEILDLVGKLKPGLRHTEVDSPEERALWRLADHIAQKSPIDRSRERAAEIRDNLSALED